MKADKIWRIEEGCLRASAACLEEWAGAGNPVSIFVEYGGPENSVALLHTAPPWAGKAAPPGTLVLSVYYGNHRGGPVLWLPGEGAGNVRVVPASRGGAWLLQVNGRSRAVLLNANSDPSVVPDEADHVACLYRSDLDGLQRLSMAESVTVCASDKLDDVSPLGEMLALRRLRLAYCSELAGLQDLGRCTGLTKLALVECPRLTDLIELGRLRSLENLFITADRFGGWPGPSRCSELSVDAAAFAPLKSLKRLSLQDVPVVNAHNLGKLVSLESLRLMMCDLDEDAGFLRHLVNLRKLWIGSYELADVGPLRPLEKLEDLTLAWAEELVSLEGLEQLTALESFSLSGSRKLACIDPLAGFAGLRHLELESLDAITDFDCLRGLISLRSLNLSAARLANLRFLAPMLKLRELRLSGRDLSDLGPIGGLDSLEKLDVSFCGNITSIDPLASLTGLKELSLSFVGEVMDFSPLAGLVALEALALTGSKHLKDAAALSDLTSLRKLSLDQCLALENVDGVKNLRGLESVALESCPGLTSLSGLNGLRRLKAARVSFWDPEARTRRPAPDRYSGGPLKLKELVPDWQKDLISSLASCPALEHLHLASDQLRAEEVLASTAVLRKDRDFILGKGEQWLKDLPQTNEPRRTVFAFARAFVFAGDHPDGEKLLRQLIAYVEQWSGTNDKLRRELATMAKSLGRAKALPWL